MAQQGFARQKVRNGKLLTVRVSFSEKIDGVEITGDFFVYPDEGLALVEKSVRGMDADANKKEMSAVIATAIEKSGITLIGIDPDSIAETIRMAMQNGVASYRT
jgi:lipoate-protein ligase A